MAHMALALVEPKERGHNELFYKSSQVVIVSKVDPQGKKKKSTIGQSYGTLYMHTGIQAYIMAHDYPKPL